VRNEGRVKFEQSTVNWRRDRSRTCPSSPIRRTPRAAPIWSRASRAAWAAGADGLIVEVHDDPARALSDAEQALVPQRFAELARALALNPDARLPLPQLRAWVDAIDAELAHLVQRRLEVAKVIGASKRQTGRAVLDPRREAAVRRTYREALSGDAELADKLVDLLIEAARHQQSIED